MLNDADFQKHASEAIEDLENRILPVADEHDFEVESGGGVLTLIFEQPPGRFIISPNSPARQIWVSALSASYKFDWDDTAGKFVLDKTREPFAVVIANLLSRQLGAEIHL